MADARKGDSSSVNLKEKKSLLDMDIGKDFLTSWKSMSMAEGDAMDFDLTPVSKGNKKSFEFGKVDMDFNLDGDFGKISSFNMDMSDLDISPPLKKDGKSKESNDSSSGKDKGKKNCFAFAFDFDELDNFNFESSPTKESSKAQRDKNNKESSPDESLCQDKEGSVHMNLTGKRTFGEGQQNPSLPGTEIAFDMDSLVGGSADLEPTRKNCPSNLAMDDASEHSAASGEVASDRAKNSPEETIASIELPKIGQSKNLVFPKPVDLDACTGTDAVQDLPVEPLSNIEPSGDSSSETQEKVDSMDANLTGLSKERDVNVVSITGSTYNYEHTMSEKPKHLQTVAISEKNNGEKSQVGLEDHVIDNSERTELSQVNALVENSRTTGAVSRVLCDTPAGRENQQHASETLKLPLLGQYSQPADQLEKDKENRREPRVTCSRFFVQAEKPECPLQKVSSTQTTFSLLSSKKMGFTQPSLVEGRDRNSSQSDRKLVSLPLQDSKILLKSELPQIRSEEICESVKICREVSGADRLQKGNKLNDPFTTEKKDMVETKSALRQTEMSVKDLDSPSMEITKKAAQNSGNPKTLASIPTLKDTPPQEHKLSSIDSGRKTADLHRLKLSVLNLDSTKSSVQKDIKSVGNNVQNRVLSRKTTFDIACILDSQKKTLSSLPIKRKTLEDDGAGIVALHPSKRLSRSPTPSRNFMEASEKVLDKKVPGQNIKESDRIKSAICNSQVSTSQIPHDVKIKEFEISFSIQNDNIKQAEPYSKELDLLCNMLRKKIDEAKEILVQAIVNSNKLLMLHNPLFDEKIRATQNLFAGLTLDGIHG